MRAWITTYALTVGITEVDGEISEHFSSMLRYGQWTAHGEGKEWHRTRESAVNRAEEMRVKKIASLAKQLAAMHRLRFTVETIETKEST